MNLVWDTVFTSEYCMVQYSLVNLVWVQYSLVNLVWVQYSLVNIVWGAVFTSKYCMGYSIHWWLWGYSIPWGVRYSLVNNVCGVRYSLGYRIHSDTGVERWPRNRGFLSTILSGNAFKTKVSVRHRQGGRKSGVVGGVPL